MSPRNFEGDEPEIRMARKLVPLEDAAEQLGITPDALNELRQRQEIYGYRDGASWKFKPEDIEKLREERSARGGEKAASESSASALPIDLSESTDDGDDMVLLSDIELGGPAPGGSSTVIGKPGAQLPEDSDIKLAGAEKESGSSSTVIGKPGQGQSALDSDIKLASGGKKDASLDSDALPVDLSGELPLDLSGGSVLSLDSPSDAGKKQSPGSDVTLASDSGSGKKRGAGSDLTLSSAADSGSVLELGPTDSPGSGKGSDITVSPSDSGISLVDPSDSGISLEEPLELSAADDDSSFDLSSDSSGTLGDSSDFDSDAVMELKGEDDFLLTPLEESVDDDSQDSGSQVIALDSEADFDDASPTVLGGPAGGLLLEADDSAGVVDPLGAAQMGATAPVMSLGMQPAMSPARQAQYSIMNVISLAACVLFLAMTGTMMFDLMRNMWAWDTPYKPSSLLMDALMKMFG